MSAKGRIRPARRALRPGVERLESREVLATFLVTSPADSGPGTLRKALTDAVAAGGGTVAFNLAGIGAHTIALASPLPAVNAPVVIDGTTQLGYAGRPLVEVEGSLAGKNPDGSNADGFHVEGGGVTIAGLAIGGFTGRGVALLYGNGNVVRACYIGVDPSGWRAKPNGGEGVFLTNSSFNTIGGSNPADGNLISGNHSEGVHVLFGGLSNNNLIANNTIGTDASGTQPLGNGGDGVGFFAASANNRILGNLISGNGGNGISFFEADSSDALIQGNTIGTDRDGVAPIANGGSGVNVGGPPRTRILNNLISGNSGQGVSLVFDTTVGTEVRGNLIGVARDGVHALGNLGQGLATSFSASDARVGGPNPGDGNVIAYNGYTFRSGGVKVEAGSQKISLQGNAIYANYGIGIDLGGDGVAPTRRAGRTRGRTFCRITPC